MRIWKKLSLGKTRMGPHSGVTARCHPMIFPGGLPTFGRRIPGMSGIVTRKLVFAFTRSRATA